jgi:hypothetical protein
MRPIAAAVFALIIAAPAALAPAALADDGPGEGRIGADARTALAVTVYEGGRAAVSETRAFEPEPGTHAYAVEGVSPAMVAGSLRLGGEGLSVFETTYAFDLLTPQAILEASVGGSVGVVRTHPTTGEESVIPATVLATRGGVVLRIGERIETGIPGRLVFDTLPEGLRPKPAVVAEIAAGGTPATLTAQYLTDGLAWAADYTALWNEDDETLTLEAWATVTNTTGVDFRRAELTLAAGRPNRVSAPKAMPEAQMMRTMAMAADAPAGAAPPQPQALAGLHLYTINRPVDLPDRQTKQIALLARPALAVEELHVFSGGPYVHGRQGGRAERAQHARLRLAFTNPADGEPLPAGIVRVYADADGRGGRFVGEDRLGHVPAGERARLDLGEAFDVTLRREQLAFEKLDFTRNATRTTMRLMVRNAGDERALVRLDERIPGDWTITDESTPHQRIDGLARWTVDVPAAGAAEVIYTVETKF